MIMMCVKMRTNLFIKNLHFYNSLLLKNKHMYKLCKDINTAFFIDDSPIIQKEEYIKPVVDNKYKHFYERTDNFINTMESNLPVDNRYLMYHNLKTLTFSSYNSINIFKQLYAHIFCGGCYRFRRNDIFINNRLVNEHGWILYHELLHMASSYKNKYSIYIHSGFCNDAIGHAINEGYTELLTERYFNDEKEEEKCAYGYYTNIAKIIENIVGRETMTNLYFKADLNGLIKELNKYAKKNDIIDFLLNLDAKFYFDFKLSILFYNNNDFLIDNINHFIINTYINKLNLDNVSTDLIVYNSLQLNNELNLINQKSAKETDNRNIIKLIKNKKQRTQL